MHTLLVDDDIMLVGCWAMVAADDFSRATSVLLHDRLELLRMSDTTASCAVDVLL